MRTTVIGLLSAVARYAVWIALSVLWLWALLEVRLAVAAVVFRLRVTPWAVPGIVSWVSVPLILLWLGLTLGLEPFLVDSETPRLFLQRALRVGVIAGAVLAASYLVQAVI